jgi:hypothetical protein
LVGWISLGAGALLSRRRLAGLRPVGLGGRRANFHTKRDDLLVQLAHLLPQLIDLSAALPGARLRCRLSPDTLAGFFLGLLSRLLGLRAAPRWASGCSGFLVRSGLGNLMLEDLHLQQVDLLPQLVDLGVLGSRRRRRLAWESRLLSRLLLCKGRAARASHGQAKEKRMGAGVHLRHRVLLFEKRVRRN